jgi:hypothetical protein
MRARAFRLGQRSRTFRFFESFMMSSPNLWTSRGAAAAELAGRSAFLIMAGGCVTLFREASDAAPRNSATAD